MFILYLTRNIVNGKIYIGVHKENKRKYFGSGRAIQNAIRKYGHENFIRETLRVCDTSWEAYRIEALIVNEVFIAREDTYNITPGGNGGDRMSYLSIFERKLISKKAADKNRGQKRSIETRQKMSDAAIGKPKGPMSTEERNKRSIPMFKPQKIVKCPHCQKQGGISLMKIWHFDKCRRKNDS